MLRENVHYFDIQYERDSAAVSAAVGMLPTQGQSKMVRSLVCKRGYGQIRVHGCPEQFAESLKLLRTMQQIKNRKLKVKIVETNGPRERFNIENIANLQLVYVSMRKIPVN